ncbi:hypothetical protein BCV69DRAFT_280291 [Microstroma glucosiphilum]|uniref:Uncharacterized protein n=1 Tax=Pseudomicrostroma glucosiphilum TaxID=1684307 RepID=A0A316UBY8_9BASI|nr:hypothetical protein BCV69DRAFT_280291 [Pseudomicrostroma glucosiphilum]PWN22689.1 hypothetical protein BCV69DRAFT_280291 [Pseudomicrostroma glucosiphilum]
MDSQSPNTFFSLGSSLKTNESATPLQPRDLNSSKMATLSNLKPSTAYDTPPPSSPTSASGRGRDNRASSVTAPYSSSPFRPAAGDFSSPAPGSSPIKARQSRVSFGSSHAADRLGFSDPFAGLEELPVSEGAEGDVSHVLYASYTHALMLGRCKPTGETHASSAAASQEEDSIAPAQGVGAKPTQHVALPNSARHVSRRHAIVEWLPFSPLVRAVDASAAAKRLPPGGFVVRILGQNGLIVEGKRRREGHVLRLQPGKTIIDFFGVKARFDVREEAQKPLSLVESQATKERTATSKRKARASMPQKNGSSPSKSDLRRVASTSAMRGGSQEDVSQMLSPTPAKSSPQLVKRSTLGRDSQYPLSPPSSSPPPLDSYVPSQPLDAGDDTGILSHSDDAEGEADDDDGAEEPMSPTLGRSRFARSSLGSRQQEQVDSEEERPGKITKLIPGANGIEASQGALDVASDAESELTPSPSPSRSATPGTTVKEMGPPTSLPAPRAARPLALTNSQIRMPPPKLPASAMLSAAANKDNSEGLRSDLREHARKCVAALAPTYDLEGLLAGAIVFHRTATISASEAVRSVLSCTQGLMRGEVGSLAPNPECISPSQQLEHGKIVPGWGGEELLVGKAGLSTSAAADRWSSIARRAWTEQLETVLQSKRMFGQIQRAGKDASGNSLEHWYYYDKEGDDDVERAANLGALAKPIRGALKTHKPIFWKKSAYPRSAEEEGNSSSNNNNNNGNSGLAAAAASSVQSSRGTVIYKDLPMTESQIGPALTPTPSAASIHLKRESSTAPSTSNGAAGILAGRKGEKVLKIDENRIWEETQPEEREKTWDPIGDMDWEGAASTGGAGKRKRR